MTEQAKKGGKPASVPDKGKDKVSDADLEKVSGGTGHGSVTQSGDWADSRGDGNIRPA